ncbi:related to Vault poly[ADP-ribose] polymerase [Cephalotrichum gorgonifer]|uniref:Related to Vault poly[ADP-ribose] polymerase n=1 Tax=Cephalotrichum gorgonifer TaxID=2041049 RepID=A0AAE8N6R1_9PEZI|nr:related to Vault poly[ADP-ribose] polymerase [Cephalotrichum gorgonifer]
MPNHWKYSHVCGLFYMLDHVRKYVPQVKTAAHTSILSSVARTTLTQTFENNDAEATWKEVKYTFPLIDGVSVVAFTCTIGDRVITGVVKEKEKARAVYEEARDRGDAAALLEQVPEAADVFLTSVGNVPPKTTVHVEITYLGELKHDAEVDGIRLTIPTVLAPRYGEFPVSMLSTTAELASGGSGGLEIVVDAQMPAGSAIKSIQSPSHPISVSIGTLSTAPDADPSLQNASARLLLPSAELEKDFVLHVVATNTSNPVAMLEKHPTLTNERALMATLVPKFALPPERPEIVFVCDRSGSMQSMGRIQNLKTALQIFLKSLPVGVKFNICSFGNRHTFLWDKSRTYDKASLEEASQHVEKFTANMGGTEMYGPIEDVFKRRLRDMNLEVLLLTDGDIWSPDALFQLIRENREESKGAIRLFTLGIGTGASSSLVEGAARAGNGFSQQVNDNEKMNSKVVRMLKAAITPHISDYTLEVKYETEMDSDDDGFELIEKVADCLVIDEAPKSGDVESPAPAQKTISLFDTSVDVDTAMGNTGDIENKYDHLPSVIPPKLLQAPFQIPTLYPFSRTSVYLLMSGETVQRPVKSVILRATSKHGPLELEIPVTTLDEPGETIHQLAARKAVKELEEGAGWIHQAKDSNQKLLSEKHEGRFSDMVEREAVRLGVRYQVGGKWCSFVAVEETDSSDTRKATHVIELDTAAGPKHVHPVCRTIGGPSGPPPPSKRRRGSPGGNVFFRNTTAASPPAMNAAQFTRARSARSPASTPDPSVSFFGSASAVAAAAPCPPPAPSPAGGSLFGAAGSPQQQQIEAILTRGERLDQLQDRSDAAAAFATQFATKAKKTSGWGSSLFGSRSRGTPSAPPPPPAPQAAAFGGGGPNPGAPPAFAAPAPALQSSASFGSPFRGGATEAAPKAPGDLLERVVSLQNFEGSWPSSGDVFQMIGATEGKIKEALRSTGEEWAELLVEAGREAMATAGVLAFLRAKLAGDEESWELIGDKAWDFLVGSVAALDGKRGDVEACLVRLF